MDIQLKNEYMTNFKVKTVPLFKQGFKSLYDSCKDANKIKKNLLKEYQATVQTVPQWNSVIIDKEYERFVKGTNCEWLGNLIMAVFKATTKELMIFKNIDPNIDVVVPSPKVFIHACYIEIARVIWKKPQLMYDNYSASKSFEVNEELETVIRTAIDVTINKYLPFESVISKFVANEDKAVTQHSDKQYLDKHEPTDEPREDTHVYMETVPVNEEEGTDLTRVATEKEVVVDDSAFLDSEEDSELGAREEEYEDSEDQVSQVSEVHDDDEEIKIIDTDTNNIIEKKLDTHMVEEEENKDAMESNDCVKEIEIIDKNMKHEVDMNVDPQVHTESNSLVVDSPVNVEILEGPPLPSIADTPVENIIEEDCTEELLSPQVTTIETLEVEDTPVAFQQVAFQQVASKEEKTVEENMELTAEMMKRDIEQSIREIKMRKNVQKCKEVLGYDIDGDYLNPKNFKAIRNRLYMENNRQWGK